MKVLIFGLGLNQGGVGSAVFFAKQKDQVRITDLKNKAALKSSLDQLKNYRIEYVLGKHQYEDIDWADLIIKNPAIKPGNPYIQYAFKKGKKVETDMGIFLQYVKPSQIIGVTGTKGKSTTASLIYEILATHPWGEKMRLHPRGVLLAGNIGKSVLDAIPRIKPDSLVILELSSFQLEAFDNKKVSPHWAIITNIYPDHLNYYKNMDEYVKAKQPIAKYQTKEDFLFMKKGDPFTTRGQKIYFSPADLPQNFSPKIKGEHNLENMAAALSVGKTFGLDEQTMLKIISKFKGIPFRMELVKTWQGVKIYNDSTATNPDASIQGIKTLGACLIHPPGELILICGGMNKGMNYEEFTKVITENVKAVFFLEGDSTNEILSVLKRTYTPGVEVQIHGPYNDLEKLLTDVKKMVSIKDVILFSPAATSFNLFQNEFDRGEKFNEAVKEIFHD